MFVSSQPGGGDGTPSPSHNTFTGHMTFSRGTPFPSHNTSNGPMSSLVDGGTPSPSNNTFTGPRSLLGGGTLAVIGVPSIQERMGYLLSRRGWGTPYLGQDRMRYPPSGIGQDGVPPSGTGYAWTGYSAGGTPLAVSRRTFLLIIKLVLLLKVQPTFRHGFSSYSCW